MGGKEEAASQHTVYFHRRRTAPVVFEMCERVAKSMSERVARARETDPSELMRVVDGSWTENASL